MHAGLGQQETEPNAYESTIREYYRGDQAYNIIENEKGNYEQSLTCHNLTSGP